jgi:hypothetical protein
VSVIIVLGLFAVFAVGVFWYIWTDDYVPSPRFTLYVVELPPADPKPRKPDNVTQEAWDAHRLYGGPLP